MSDRKSSRNRRSCVSLVFLFLASIGCLGVLVVFLGVQYLPELAQKDFGPVAAGINPFQKALYSLELLIAKEDLTNPVSPKSGSISFKISPGESVNSIALKLENSGLIRDANRFRTLMIYSGKDKNIQAGDYQLSPALTAKEILSALQDSSLKEASLRILAGWRLEEIAAALPYTGLNMPPADFLQAAKNPTLLQKFTGIRTTRNLEGFFLPDVYRFPRESNPEEIIQAILENFNRQMNDEVKEGLRQQGLDLYQGIILASIVQREAVMESEQPTIASVFINRLKKGMKLDSDPTVQFALGYVDSKKTWWKNPLSLEDLKINSAYNTYFNLGLPPGPICNPGLSAIRAVAFPAQTPYYYFRARCDGSGRHNFTVTYDEHLRNACP